MYLLHEDHEERDVTSFLGDQLLEDDGDIDFDPGDPVEDYKNEAIRELRSR